MTDVRRLSTIAVTAIVALSVAACSIKDGDGGRKDGMTTVEWDLSAPRSAGSLEGGDGDTAIVTTPGEDGVDIRLTLPGDEVTSGRWGLVTARDGVAGTVETVELTSSALSEPSAWQQRIDGFVDEFGGDSAAIDAWVTTAVADVAAGDVEPGRTFRGDPRDGFRPSLTVRPGGGGESPVDVVVEWSFDFG